MILQEMWYNLNRKAAVPSGEIDKHQQLTIK